MHDDEHSHGRIFRSGNSLAVRLGARLAGRAGLSEGVNVTIALTNQGVLIRPADQPLLEERLLRYDPSTHGGETITES